MPTRTTLSPAPKARRQREYRRRQREGVRLVRLGVRPGVLDALVEHGWLGKADTHDAKTIGDAIDDLLDCWARGTLAPDPTRRAKRYDITGPVEIVGRKGYVRTYVRKRRRELERVE